MKRIVISILFVALSLAHANDITNAYAKEFAFLKAQKTELQNRLQKEKNEQDTQIMKLKPSLI